MTSPDPNKKSTRSFECRDVLWETFEQMARELECSVGYLINESMKQYARQRSYGAGSARTPFPGGQQGGREPMPASTAIPTPAAPAPPPMRGPGPLPAPPSRASSALPAPPPRPPSALPAPPQRTMSLPQPPSGVGLPSRPAQMPSRPPPAPPPPAQRSAPPPIPRGMPQPPPAYAPQPQPASAMLSVFYQGDKVPVTKERFVIGRGKQSSDLTLKDPNVSRQHAMVEFQNGVYFMVDMGSTNGVEYNGQRIARKQIAEGDVYRICDHDLRFTYR